MVRNEERKRLLKLAGKSLIPSNKEQNFTQTKIKSLLVSFINLNEKMANERFNKKRRTKPYPQTLQQDETLPYTWMDEYLAYQVSQKEPSQV